jgi:hypothetical protein
MMAGDCFWVFSSRWQYGFVAGQNGFVIGEGREAGVYIDPLFDEAIKCSNERPNEDAHSRKLGHEF